MFDINLNCKYFVLNIKNDKHFIYLMNLTLWQIILLSRHSRHSSIILRHKSHNILLRHFKLPVTLGTIK